MSSANRQVTANEWRQQGHKSVLLLLEFAWCIHSLLLICLLFMSSLVSSIDSKCPVTACHKWLSALITDDFNKSCPRRTAGDCLAGHWPPTRCFSFSRSRHCISIHPRSSSSLSWAPEGSGCKYVSKCSKLILCPKIEDVQQVFAHSPAIEGLSFLSSKIENCKTSLWISLLHRPYQHISISASSHPLFIAIICFTLHLALTAQRPSSNAQSSSRISTTTSWSHSVVGLEAACEDVIWYPWDETDETSNLMRRSHVPRWLWWLCLVAPDPRSRLVQKHRAREREGSAAQCNLPHPDSKERHTVQNSESSILVTSIFFVLHFSFSWKEKGWRDCEQAGRASSPACPAKNETTQCT